MGKLRFFGVFLTIALVLLSLPGGLASSATPHGEDSTGVEIEPDLLAALQSEGQADLFVVFRDQADLSPAYRMSWEERGEFVYQALRETADRSQAEMRAWLEARGIPYESFFINNSIYVAGADLALTHELAAFARVSRLRLERIWTIPEPIVAEEAPALPRPTMAWGLLDIQADDVWALGYKGAGIKVANIDSGVQWNHPALDQAFACPGQPTNPICWSDPGSGCGASGACDHDGHGTHTMGTMVGDDDPNLRNIVGVAPDAKWIACKGCDAQKCYDSHTIACADWILAPGEYPSNRPHIVNASWGGTPDGDPWYSDQVNAWRAAGIFPAFSAGNLGPSCDSLGDPGSYQESFASAAHDSSRTIASFSSRGPSAFGDDPYTKPNISAPGVNVFSSVPTNSWSYLNGTSVASPHTAGAVALIWQACPAYKSNIDATFQILQNNAGASPGGDCGAPPGGQGNYTYGYGYLNVLAAVNACVGSPPPPTPTVTPTPVPSSCLPILVVDDDNGSDFETYYTEALSALGKEYDRWTVRTQGSPSLATLLAHSVVIWFTGNDRTTTLTGTDEINLASYLSSGGALFITGQDIGYDIHGDSFYGSYLHAGYSLDNTSTHKLWGADILSGLTADISGGDGANNQTYPSEISLGSGAVGLYNYDGGYNWGGLRWQGAYKVVYFAFGFEAIDSSVIPDQRTRVMDKLLRWLGDVWLSLTADATLPAVGPVNDEDIVALDRVTGVYSWVFDGSDVGITTDVDAFDVLANGHILMSFDVTTSVPSVGYVADVDVVEFIPTTLGAATSGTFTLYFDGSDVELGWDGDEDIDAIARRSDGTLLLSARKFINATGVSAADEDLALFTPTSLGSTTAGTWSLWFDGSDVGLDAISENVDGVWVDEGVGSFPDVYLNTVGTFSVTGASGENEDLFIFHPTSLGSNTAGTFGPGLYMDGSVYGLSNYDVDAFDVLP